MFTIISGYLPDLPRSYSNDADIAYDWLVNAIVKKITAKEWEFNKIRYDIVTVIERGNHTVVL